MVGPPMGRSSRNRPARPPSRVIRSRHQRIILNLSSKPTRARARHTSQRRTIANKRGLPKASPRGIAASALREGPQKEDFYMATKTGGIHKPVTPSADLAAVVGKGPMPRSEIVSKLWEYIKKNNLQDSKDKR